ncbi:MAG TPA: hypothetical protein VN106_02205 [Sphingomicrobium sp.]|jgi:hypothetical protein|nr:hypothetical protein [Sphingomicrobium sp.]
MSKPGKTTVDLKEPARPSRIRRDPVTSEKPQSLVSRTYFQSREWEIGLAIAGIVAFALALNVIWVALSAWVHL